MLSPFAPSACPAARPRWARRLAARLGLVIGVLVVGLSHGAKAAPQGATPPLPSAVAPKVATQSLSYTLRIGDKVVGKREVKVRHVPGPTLESEETRIIESWIDVDAEIAGQQVKVRQRATARASGGRLSFTSVNDENGRVSEVQGKRLGDGRWLINIVDRTGARSFEYRKSQVDLCTLDLLDPELHRRLTDKSTARVLLVETGDVLEGPAKDLGESTLKVGATELPVTRATFTPTQGRLTMDWNLEGLLVAYEIGFMGQRMSATVTAPPDARVWGEVSVPLRFGAGVEVGEDEL
jgi:hypothetical protein